MPITTDAERFSRTAAGYAATMAPSLRPVAAQVVCTAVLRPGERVLDLGTGTGAGAAAARGDGRSVTGVDAAPGMLAIARAEVPGVEFREMDFAALDFKDASFDVLIAIHALLFATDQPGVLREWLRVAVPGGRLSLSVPGPDRVTPSAIYAEVYRRHGIDRVGRYPTAEALVRLAMGAGWAEVAIITDESTEIRLSDEASFRTWRAIGMRGSAAAELTPQQHRVLTDEMLAVTPRSADGAFHIPFGTIYLSARKPR